MSEDNATQLPRITSETITVQALLTEIRRLILEEPKRLSMSAWVSMFQGETVNAYGASKLKAGLPACGTVACLAGWGAVLLRPDDAPAATLDRYAELVFEDLLGYGSGSGRGVGELFSPDVIDLDDTSWFEHDEDDEPILPPSGTLEHAEAVARRIDTYIAQHPEIMDRVIDVADARVRLS